MSTLVFSQNAVIPKNIRLDATFENISVNWEIDGDAKVSNVGWHNIILILIYEII